MDSLEKNSADLRIISFYSEKIVKEKFIDSQNNLNHENYVIGVIRHEFGP